MNKKGVICLFVLLLPDDHDLTTAYICPFFLDIKGFPGNSVGKEATCNAGDPSSIPGLKRSAGEGLSFPGGSIGKESACNARDLGSILGLGKSPGEGNSYPLQYSDLDNSHGSQRARHN